MVPPGIVPEVFGQIIVNGCFGDFLKLEKTEFIHSVGIDISHSAIHHLYLHNDGLCTDHQHGQRQQ